MITCPACAQGLRFDPARQLLVCDYCDNTYAPTVMQPGKEAVNQADSIIEGTLFTCTQCGGEILSDSDTAITFCSFCGSSMELAGRTVSLMAPSYIVPFKKSKEECKELYKSFIKKAIFAPAYMKEEAQVEKFRGIYMPYWTYSFKYDGIVPMKGHTERRSGDYIVKSHYNMNTDMNINYRGVSFDASSSFSDVYSEAIAPYRMSDCVEFSTAYMAGFYADTADVSSNTYEAKAKEVIGKDVNAIALNNNSELKKYHVSSGDNSVSVLLNKEDEKMAYFPVWFMSTKHNDKVSYAVINGQTGKVAADIPIDFTKYILGSVILAVPFALIYNFMFSFTPGLLNILSMLLALTGLFIANGEMNKLYTRDNYFDDLGYITAHKMKTKVKEEIQKENREASKVEKTTTKMFSLISMVAFYIAFFVFYIGAGTENFDVAFPIAALAVVVGILLSLLGKSASKTAKPSSVILKQPFSQKKSVLLKPIAALIIGVILFIAKPYRDFVYYAVVMVMMALILLTFFDIVKLHNRMASRLPRQFNKRGGDEK